MWRFRKLKEFNIYRKKTIASLLKYFAKHKFIAQILISFVIIFVFGTIAFVLATQYISLDLLNSYFSLLSSLSTIFAAIVAFFIMQDFREQKRAELLSQISKEKLETIKFIYIELSSISYAIIIECNYLDKTNIQNKNFLSLSDRLKEIDNNKELKVICINFTQNFEEIFKLVSKKDQKLIVKTNDLLKDYIYLISNLEGLIEGYGYILPKNEGKIFECIKRNSELFNEIDGNLKELQTLLKNHSLYL